MQKGKVNVNMLYLKRGGYLHKGESITSDDVSDFDQLIEKGHIISEETGKESDLMKLKKDELQLKCVELEIDYEESNTKAELVALIENSEK